MFFAKYFFTIEFEYKLKFKFWYKSRISQERTKLNLISKIKFVRKKRYKAFDRADTKK